jgi:hypothetical protein
MVEWSSNGAGSNMALEGLYMMCAKDRAVNEGKVPVVKYVGAELMKVGKGNTRKPKWELVQWIPRPAAMDGEDEAPVAPAPKVDEEF